jgi:hypothetical protein
VYHPVELLHEWATRRNAVPARSLEASAVLEPWQGTSGPSGLAIVPSLVAEPDLLIVLMTYARPDACRRVLTSLARAIEGRGRHARTALVVFRDACDRDYSEVRALAPTVGATALWLDARRHLGKKQFWRSYQAAMYVAQCWRPARTLFLHDDLEFDADLLDNADALWQATADDPLRRVLYLMSSSKDEENGRWIEFARRDFPDKGCRLTNWFDLQAFMVDREFFELLRYRMVPIHPNRWKRKPTSSSGVGRQLTLRLRGRGHTYQAWPPLVSHGAEPCIANPEARAKTDLDNREDYALAAARRALTVDARAPDTARA